jgi:hypothetical protein
LLESIFAIGLMATMLAPTLAALRQAMQQSSSTTVQRFLLNYATLVLEEESWKTARTGGTRTEVATLLGPFRSRTTVIDDPQLAGATNLLMRLTVVVWEDRNGDSLRNDGEANVALTTKVARLQSYGSL